jgi:hypothetical protein
VNYHPQAFINGVLIPLKKTSKILGLNYHPLGIYSPHADINGDKCTSRLQIIKAVHGHGSGDRETLRLTYQALIKPVLENLAAVRFPSVGSEHTCIKHLQRVQNAAMRLISGCHKISGQKHLLAEGNFLPVAKHLELIYSQLFASAYREEHPSHRVIKQPTGTRPGRKGIVHTLQSRFNHVVEPYLSDGVISPQDLRKSLTTSIPQWFSSVSMASGTRSLAGSLMKSTPQTAAFHALQDASSVSSVPQQQLFENISGHDRYLSG